MINHKTVSFWDMMFLSEDMMKKGRDFFTGGDDMSLFLLILFNYKSGGTRSIFGSSK
jgi:hypothetical protein